MNEALRNGIVGAGKGAALGIAGGGVVAGFIWLATRGARAAVGMTMVMCWALVLWAPPASRGVGWSLDADTLRDPTRRLQAATLLMQVGWALMGLGAHRLRSGYPFDSLLTSALALPCVALGAGLSRPPTGSVAGAPKLLVVVHFVGVLAAWAYWITVQES